MDTKILPQSPRTRKSAADAWLNERIGPRGAEQDGPQFGHIPQDDEHWTARGYVKVATAYGYQWERPDEIRAVDFDAGNPEPEKPSTIYTLAREAVEARRDAWPSGESVRIWERGGVIIYLKEYQGLIDLVAVNGDPTRAARVRAGHFSYGSGWVFSLGIVPYTNWTNKVKALAGVS